MSIAVLGNCHVMVYSNGWRIETEIMMNIAAHGTVRWKIVTESLKWTFEL